MEKIEKHNEMDILVTFDENYCFAFQTMLFSMVINNPECSINVWLLHSNIRIDILDKLEKDCNKIGVKFNSIQVNRDLFKMAPVTNRYPQEMYYRLLAPLLLPSSLQKILYIDPDVLIINSLSELWNLDMKGNCFAAASHIGVIDVINDVNRLRLGTNHDYYNSGVMLIDLNKARNIVKSEDIFDCVREHSAELLLPDQDVFNYLYGKFTLDIEDEKWNYDARCYSSYLVKSNGKSNLNYVMLNTAILHFCGKKKPWKTSYSGRFAALYKHYEQLSIKYYK